MRKDIALGINVHSRQSIIQYQYVGFPDKGTRNRGSLFLPPRKGNAPLPNHRLKSVLKRANILQYVGFHGGPFDFGLISPQTTEGNVFSQRFRKQKHVLGDVTDAFPEFFDRQVSNVLPIDVNRARLNIQQARDEFHQSRFSGACSTDNS